MAGRSLRTSATSTTESSWFDAEEFCNDKDGHLASITNQETHMYLRYGENVNKWEGGVVTDVNHEYQMVTDVNCEYQMASWLNLYSISQHNL